MLGQSTTSEEESSFKRYNSHVSTSVWNGSCYKDFSTRPDSRGTVDVDTTYNADLTPLTKGDKFTSCNDFSQNQEEVKSL